MHLILISDKPKTAKSVVFSARHLIAGAVGVALIVLVAALALARFGWQHLLRADAMHDLLAAADSAQTPAIPSQVSAKLDAMAARIGKLQAQTTVLNLRGASLAALAGIKPREFGFDVMPGQGGPAPAPYAGVLSMDEIERELDRLAAQLGNRTANLDALEAGALDHIGRSQLLPSMVPVRNARIGSGFGVRTDPFTGRQAMHEGLDFDAPVGTPIMAAGGGVVIFAGFHHEFGNLVVIDHGHGVITRYGHCSRIDVKEGEIVLRGQVIGAVGETGRATGPHLHFEVRYQDVAQNPSTYLQADLRRLHLVAGARNPKSG